MGLVKYIREEIQVIRERDPAIKSNWEVFLYPSFKVILSYRVAHRLYRKKHYSWPDGYPSRQPGRRGLRYTPVPGSGRGSSLTTGPVSS